MEKTFNDAIALLAENLAAWEDEEDSVKKEHEALITKTRLFLSAVEQWNN